MNIVLAIHPEWAEKIYSKEKVYEYRKTFPDNFNAKKDCIFLYETSPVRKITGSITIDEKSSIGFNAAGDSFPEDVNPEKGCVNLESLDAYWTKGNGMLYILRIKSVYHFYKSCEMELKDFGLHQAPQSWAYAIRNQTELKF